MRRRSCRQLEEQRTGALADSVLGGREVPLRTGADEITPDAYRRVRQWLQRCQGTRAR